MTPHAESNVALRPLPFSYRALLAICSDLDETPDRNVYLEIARFLNTTGPTCMGPGVGLEVGNTIYFDMPAGQFSFRNTDDAGRAMVKALIESGHIDCLHSYGDFSTTRDHAARALDEIAGFSRHLEIWIDHAVAPSNFGADIMCGRGDVPGNPVYHADLTCASGVQYVWRGRVTSVLGQDVAPKLRGIWSAQHPASARTLAKEATKHVLGRLGSCKYAMHPPNRVLQRSTLRDGRPVLEFLRCNPHPAGVSVGDTGRGIGEVLIEAMIARLIASGGVCVLYTHLGKICQPEAPFDAAGVAGLRCLADAYQQGRILVTTTRRLLGYCRMRAEIDWSARREGDDTWIEVRSRPTGGLPPLTASDFDGLTFHADQPQRTRMRIDGREVANLRRNAPDATGRGGISVPWPRLEFPTL